MPDIATIMSMPTVEQAAEELGLHKNTVRRMIAHGELVAYRIGSKLIRVDLASLNVTAL